MYERKRILEILLNEYAPNKYKNINLDEIAEQTIGFTGADLLQLLNESLLVAALEGRDYITQKDLLKAKDNIKPSALREFYMESQKIELTKSKIKKGSRILHNSLSANLVLKQFCYVKI